MAIVNKLPELSDTVKQDIEKGVDILKQGGCTSMTASHEVTCLK